MSRSARQKVTEPSAAGFWKSMRSTCGVDRWEKAVPVRAQQLGRAWLRADAGTGQEGPRQLGCLHHTAPLPARPHAGIAAPQTVQCPPLQQSTCVGSAPS